MADGAPTVALDVVVRRFADAEAALANVRRQLESLASSAERAERTSASLEDAAIRVTGFATAAHAAATALEGAASAAHAALEANAQLVDGSALTSLQASLTQIDRALAESTASVSAGLGSLEQRLTRLEGLSERLVLLENIDARTTSIEKSTVEITGTIDRLWKALPGRWQGRA